MLEKFNEQLMILIQFESMVERRKQDYEQLGEKEEQFKHLVNALTWNLKELLSQN